MHARIQQILAGLTHLGRSNPDTVQVLSRRVEDIATDLGRQNDTKRGELLNRIVTRVTIEFETTTPTDPDTIARLQSILIETDKVLNEFKTPSMDHNEDFKEAVEADMERNGLRELPEDDLSASLDLSTLSITPNNASTDLREIKGRIGASPPGISHRDSPALSDAIPSIEPGPSHGPITAANAASSPTTTTLARRLSTKGTNVTNTVISDQPERPVMPSLSRSVEEYLASKQPLEIPNVTSQVRLLPGGRTADGTYATVYSGTYSNCQVAIKVLRMAKTEEKSRKRFLRELFIWSKLKHPNVLTLYGYYEFDDGGRLLPSLISEWAENGSAEDYLKHKLDWNKRTSLLLDVAKGLQYLHEFKAVVVHGDLKPQNVVITKHGIGQLCDFGLTRFMQNDMRTGLTTSTAHTGTTLYLAYELVEYDDKPLPTIHTDVYALGCLALQFIYGTPPHASLGMNLRRILDAIGSNKPPAVRPNTSVALLWDLIEPCWSVLPTMRPTAAKFCQDLWERKDTLPQALATTQGKMTDHK